VLHYLPQQTYPLLMLGSMAASAVLLFVVPHSPFSQPWNLIGGNTVSAIAGWTCSLWIPDPALAAGVAVGVAIFLMYVLRCLHPPGAATALTLVLSSAQFSAMGWQWVGEIVIVNAGIMLLSALLINNVLPGRKYPVAFNVLTPPKMTPGAIPQQTDIEWALTQMDSVIDVSLEDLTEIYTIAQNRATDRYESSQKKS
jgi:CBS-domain-containing membrane protein